MKKWYIMLAFAMLLLSGCGKQAESTEVDTEESNTEEQPVQKGPSRDELKASLKIDSVKKNLLKRVKEYR